MKNIIVMLIVLMVIGIGFLSVSETESKDTDGDGYLDDEDAFTSDNTEWLDTDKDGFGDIIWNGKENKSIGCIPDQILFLFAPVGSKITYLIDNTGAVKHTWSSSYLPGESIRWLGNGMILRTIKLVLYPGGAGGGVQKIAWDGTVVWDFRYASDKYLSHHDIYPLSNGNVLMIAWEIKTREDAIAAGRNPNCISLNEFMPDHIIEVQPTEPTGGTIVWEWHVWDHLIQDYDPSKANYGVVKDHPELVDINYGSSNNFDWMHTNSIDYNEEFDQILISVSNFNEIWVIDHSTTTAEAAGHTGGNSGKGGDLLYRWGNPEAYRAGTPSDQKFFNQHDATWIDEGCPGAGHILVFNNGLNRPSGRYSSVDEIVPPVNRNGEYYLESGLPYGPATQTWIFGANSPTSFYSGYLSGAERLVTGNTLICSGESGVFFEVTLAGVTVWTYTNPYPTKAANNVFKIVYIPIDEIPNNPPNTPNNPSPPQYATDVDININLSWTGGDPNVDDTVTYDVYFGNEYFRSMMSLQKVANNISTTSYSPGVLYNSLTYYWTIVAWDNHGASTNGPSWYFTTIDASNNPPDKPSTPYGETNGKIGKEYLYTTSTTDPNGDQVYYRWDWGDGNISEWLGPYDSGVKAGTTYEWAVKDSFNVKVKAKDIYGKESVWSDPLSITMPYTPKPLLQQFFERLFQRFPHAFPLLRYLTGY